VWTSAAHADRFAGGSFLIIEARKHPTAPPSAPGVHIVRNLRSWAMRYREQAALKDDASLGEEAVLTGTKHAVTP